MLGIKRLLKWIKVNFIILLLLSILFLATAQIIYLDSIIEANNKTIFGTYVYWDTPDPEDIIYFILEEDNIFYRWNPRKTLVDMGTIKKINEKIYLLEREDGKNSFVIKSADENVQTVYFQESETEFIKYSKVSEGYYGSLESLKK